MKKSDMFPKDSFLVSPFSISLSLQQRFKIQKEESYKLNNQLTPLWRLDIKPSLFDLEKCYVRQSLDFDMFDNVIVELRYLYQKKRDSWTWICGQKAGSSFQLKYNSPCRQNPSQSFSAPKALVLSDFKLRVISSYLALLRAFNNHIYTCYN